MKLSAVIASLAAAGSSVAAPSEPKTFNLMALRSASPIHFAPVSAARSSIFLNLKDQGAECKGDSYNRATFYLKDGGLFLYSKGGKRQQIFVDRSGMGQGKMGYLTDNTYPPPHFELTGWTIDKYEDLNFKGISLLACPGSFQDAWSVWVVTDNLTPGGNKGCLGIISRTISITKPVSCEYSQ
ncbi:hypothetical protein TOPH_03119 [Tolypocladium ophioglossoides CBS 100239]|uniref:Cell wall protein phiA n=1 Tax=Tolypocladium ophioglossoides (strain CBS 100239) TaxID=1163406 RepID=A0A0L0NEI4_TOLOC|nr:hypothetical protein TOPH_03119 [Tolypocladium ophioglossoides CBS 100239]